MTLPHGDPVAVELTTAIHGGDLDALRRIVADRRELASAHMIGRKGLDGARVDKLWHAVALGMLERIEQLLRERPEAPGELSQAFWHACAGGQRRAAEYLLAGGADLNWIPEYAEGTPLDSATSLGTRQENVVSWLRERGATSAKPLD